MRVVDDVMRVVTLNVWAREGDYPARREVLATGFAGLAPDLVVLQETIVASDFDQAAEILPSGLEIVHSGRRAHDGMGVSLASRWPITQVEELALDGSRRDDGFPCVTLIATIQAPGLDAPLRFVNHFPSWKPQQELERERQAVQAAGHLEQLDGHVIIAGDFDADPHAASMRFWTGRQSLAGISVCYRDAWAKTHPDIPLATFSPTENPLVADADWPHQQIDHLLVRCGEHGGPTLPIHDCRRVFDETPASDHFGLLAELG